MSIEVLYTANFVEGIIAIRANIIAGSRAGEARHERAAEERRGPGREEHPGAAAARVPSRQLAVLRLLHFRRLRGRREIVIAARDISYLMYNVAVR